jgi:hypothetical protein
MDVQAALTALLRYHPLESGPDVRIAVFFWVCRTIKVRDAEKSNPCSFASHSARTPPALDRAAHLAGRQVRRVVQSLLSLRKDDGRRVRRVEVEGVHSRHDQRNAPGKGKGNMTTTTPMSTPSRSQPQSPSASPTKSALRDASKTPAVPRPSPSSTRPPQKMTTASSHPTLPQNARAQHRAVPPPPPQRGRCPYARDRPQGPSLPPRQKKTRGTLICSMRRPCLSLY